MCVQIDELDKNEEKNLIIRDLTYQLGFEFPFCSYIKERKMREKVHCYVDRYGGHFIMAQSMKDTLEHENSVGMSKQETYVIMPLNSEKSLVYFFSDFDYGDMLSPT